VSLCAGSAQGSGRPGQWSKVTAIFLSFPFLPRLLRSVGRVGASADLATGGTSSVLAGWLASVFGCACNSASVLLSWPGQRRRGVVPGWVILTRVRHVGVQFIFSAAQMDVATTP
jgi:hypothetical protein